MSELVAYIEASHRRQLGNPQREARPRRRWPFVREGRRETRKKARGK